MSTSEKLVKFGLVDSLVKDGDFSDWRLSHLIDEKNFNPLKKGDQWSTGWSVVQDNVEIEGKEFIVDCKLALPDSGRACGLNGSTGGQIEQVISITEMGTYRLSFKSARSHWQTCSQADGTFSVSLVKKGQDSSWTDIKDLAGAGWTTRKVDFPLTVAGEYVLAFKGSDKDIKGAQCGSWICDVKIALPADGEVIEFLTDFPDVAPSMQFGAVQVHVRNAGGQRKVGMSVSPWSSRKSPGFRQNNDLLESATPVETIGSSHIATSKEVMWAGTQPGSYTLKAWDADYPDTVNTTKNIVVYGAAILEFNPSSDTIAKDEAIQNRWIVTAYRDPNKTRRAPYLPVKLSLLPLHDSPNETDPLAFFSATRGADMDVTTDVSGTVTVPDIVVASRTGSFRIEAYGPGDSGSPGANLKVEVSEPSVATKISFDRPVTQWDTGDGELGVYRAKVFAINNVEITSGVRVKFTLQNDTAGAHFGPAATDPVSADVPVGLKGAQSPVIWVKSTGKFTIHTTIMVGGSGSDDHNVIVIAPPPRN
ncbi:DUF642 domain-containing protein [Paraburkholderia caffeinilytica]|uniref:DUF642 domain-containing protein n=1 Tax=Paraburkholderia caffeinilytica TaxID=1761016 RepID=UPI003DA126F4